MSAARPFSRHAPRGPHEVEDIRGARVLAVFGDSITTDHISPAGTIQERSPAGQYLVSKGVAPKEFNSYGARRGNHEVMVRGTFANVRIRNRLAPGTEGGCTIYLPADEVTSIYEASQRYLAGRDSAHCPRRQGLRVRLQPGLGGEGSLSPRRARGHRRKLRADSPVEPRRHGDVAPAIRGRGLGRESRADWAGNFRHRGRHRWGRERLRAVAPADRPRPPRGRQARSSSR